MVNRKCLKQALYAGAITGGLMLLDQICGNQSLTEMYNVLQHAAPNGDPIGSTISLFADNADRLSLIGWGALGAGAATAYKGIEGIVRKEKPKE